MAYSDVVLADGPIAYWKLDETSGNFADSSGNSFTAIVTGDPIYRRPGPSQIGGFAVQYVETPTPDFATAEVTSLNTASGAEVMVEMWFNWFGLLAGDELFAFQTPAVENYAVWIRDGDERLGFNTFNGDAYGIPTEGNIATGFWYMGNFAFKEGDRDACRMWINGVEKSPLSDVQTEGPANTLDPTCLIGIGAAAQHGFTGYLAHVSLYNRWLPQARITAHFNAAGSELRARHGIGMGRW